jgi:hypothetical protein
VTLSIPSSSIVVKSCARITRALEPAHARTHAVRTHAVGFRGLVRFSRYLFLCFVYDGLS